MPPQVENLARATEQGLLAWPLSQCGACSTVKRFFNFLELQRFARRLDDRIVLAACTLTRYSE